MDPMWLGGVALAVAGVIARLPAILPELRRTVDWWDERQARRRRSALARKRRANATHSSTQRSAAP